MEASNQYSSSRAVPQKINDPPISTAVLYVASAGNPSAIKARADYVPYLNPPIIHERRWSFDNATAASHGDW